MRTSISLLLLVVFVSGCIGEDVINDFVEPTLRINNPLDNLEVGDSHQFETTYSNTIGVIENIDLNWSSSDTTIAKVSHSGLVTGIAQGEVSISASFMSENETFTASNTITVTDDETSVEVERQTGTIVSTSGYVLEGSFIVEKISEEGGVRIEVNDDYRASSSLPGLYLYFTNNPNSINGAYEVGLVTVFNGAHSYEVPEVNLNEYTYLLYWCKPFRVKVGEGEIN